jgi:hypothetical protein
MKDRVEQGWPGVVHLLEPVEDMFTMREFCMTGYGDGLEGVEGTAAGVQEVEQRRSSCEGFRNNTSLHYSLL